MAEEMYHPTTPEIHQLRRELAPHTHDAFEAFSRAVFADGPLPEKTKQLIAVAVAAEMRAGGAYAHATLALEELAK